MDSNAGNVPETSVDLELEDYMCFGHASLEFEDALESSLIGEPVVGPNASAESSLFEED